MQRVSRTNIGALVIMEASGSMSMKGLPVRRPPAINRFFSSTPVSIVIYLLIIVSILYSSFRGAQSMGYNWQWYQIPKYIYSYTDDGFQFGELMFGLWTTITLSFSALVCGAWSVAMTSSLSASKPSNKPALSASVFTAGFHLIKVPLSS